MVRVFRHYIPKEFLVLALTETVALIVSFYAGVTVRFTGDIRAAESLGLLPSKGLLFMLVMMGAMTGMGLYHRSFREGIWSTFLRITVSFVTGVLFLSLVFYVVPVLYFGRGVLALATLFGFVTVVGTRFLFYRYIATREGLKRRVMVLGSGANAATLGKFLRRRTDKRGFSIVGYIHLPREHSQVSGPVIPYDRSLLEIARQYDVDEFVVAMDDRRKGFPVQEIVDCRMAGMEVVEVLTFFERQAGKLVLDLLHPSYLIYSDGFKYGAARIVTKRLFDIAAGIALLALAWPLMLAAALAIYVESHGRGPVLYRQVRVGENWKLFQVLKFRSMTVDAEADGAPQWAEKNDPRITRVGRIIRLLRIDELPQILNVLRGDMSFVGPRPERPEFVEQLSRNVIYYGERHRVKPGITGWAQICYPYGSSEQDAVEKLQYDLYYVKNYSLFFDLLILLQTCQAVLWGNGAR